jgi:hypothetical protein
VIFAVCNCNQSFVDELAGAFAKYPLLRRLGFARRGFKGFLPSYRLLFHSSASIVKNSPDATAFVVSLNRKACGASRAPADSYGLKVSVGNKTVDVCDKDDDSSEKEPLREQNSR